MKRRALTLLLALGCRHPSAPTPAPEAPASLVFRLNGADVRTLSLHDLTSAAAPRTVTVFDPYYQHAKTFRAIPLDAVLRAGFRGAVTAPLATQHFVLRARDGYTVPITGERLLDVGAHLAIADTAFPSWEPIGPQHVNPGPFYLIWTGAEQTDQESYPRPWQLAAIEITPFERVFPHTVPTASPEGSPARRGFELFAHDCIHCHAINREGGHVGPDLNVPQNITEYRPELQIRQYIRNPLTFRYGAMPAHPNLTDADLDALLAYLRAMRELKYDPPSPRTPP